MVRRPGDPNNGAAGLTGALAFVLLCGATYYATELLLLSGYNPDPRVGRLWTTVSSSLAQVEGRLEHAVLEVEDELGLQHTQALPLHLEPRPASHPLSEAEGTRPASHHQSEEVEGDTHYATKSSTSLSSNLKPLKPAQDDKEAPTITEEAAESTAALSSSPPSTPVLRGAEPPDANGKCTRPRRPYHVVMTAASGKYQEWQSRVAYYHYLKQKREHPCSDMGGFTRLFNTPGAQPDSLMDEIPTLLVHQLKAGRCDECDHGFIVMNRPWGIVQLINSEHWRSSIPEEWVMVTETDHMFMAPPPNDATERRPVGFKFYYMTAMDAKLKPVVTKFLAPGIDPSTVDQAGPSPIIIHKPLLAEIARPWWEMSIRMKRDHDANAVFGWVLEMWGYNIAARNMGIRHLDWQDLQVEPQGIGTDDMDGKYIYHYTFGLTVHDQSSAWRLDKRMFFGTYPSDHMKMPPMCSQKSGFLFAGMINEAAQNIPGWPNRQPNPTSSPTARSPLSRLRDNTDISVTSVKLGQMLMGTGPWKWRRIDSLYFFSRGILYIASANPENLGTFGRWSVVGDDAVSIRMCGDQYLLHFVGMNGARDWAFRVEGDTEEGSLNDRAQMTDRMLPHLAVVPGSLGEANTSFVAELAGSGPWRWGSSGPFAFLRGGILLTPWGVGLWGVQRSTPDGSTELARPNQVFADFAGSFHTLSWFSRECLRLTSTRKADGDKVGVELEKDSGMKCDSKVQQMTSHK